MKIFCGFRVSEYALWQKTKTWKCQKPTESFLNQKIPIANSYHYQKTAKKLPIWYLSTIFGFNNQKSYLFQGSMLSFVDNFEQHFESCVLITQNPLKIALNKINGLNTSKIQLIKIFRGFRVFEYALQQNTKTRKHQKSSKSQKTPISNSYHQLKSYQFGILLTFCLQEQVKLLLSFLSRFMLISLRNTLRAIP